GAVRLDRFSPYFCEPEANGIVNVRPMRALTYIYPLPPDHLHNVAYYFDFDFADGRDPLAYIGSTMKAVERWREREQDAFLLGLPWRDRLLLWDERGDGPGSHRLLEPAARALYEFCDQV